jgi:UDP-N-acetylglucosamine 2-epimerase
MKVMVVGETGRPHELAAALETEGVEVGRPPEGALPDAPADEVGQIARGLIAFEKLFAEDAPDAVLLASASNLALAAVLAATKAQIPVAALEQWAPGQDTLSELNRRLIARLADVRVAGDAGTIATSLRDLVTV